MKFFSAIASLVACASAYKVLTPTANSTIAKGSTVNVQWSTVDTDASTFSIYLVNFATGHFPPTVLSLAQDVAQGAGSVNVRIPCSVSSDSGYQLNFINGTNTYVIYAQSSGFQLTGDCVDPVATSTADAKYNNASVSTVYQTIVYENPVVWFVQPNNLVAAAAICPPASQQTVTVQAAALAASTVTVQASSAAAQTVTQTVTVASCPSQAAIIAAIANAQGTGAAAAAAVSVSSTNATTNATASVSGAATKAAVPTSTLPASKNSAGKVGGAVTGLVAAFAVMLL